MFVVNDLRIGFPLIPEDTRDGEGRCPRDAGFIQERWLVGVVRGTLVEPRGDVLSGASLHPAGDERGIQPVVAAQGAEAAVGVDNLLGNPRRYFRAAQG